VQALRLYERAGFEIEGRLTGEFLLGGVWVDDVIMALSFAERRRVGAEEDR
jgi:RimJ/RimL family protein N-acetyltransferase